MRYTKDLAIHRVKMLCNALGKEYGTRYKGQWQVAEGLNGLQIVALANNEGGLDTPFGHEVFSPKELYHVVNFALRAIQLDRLNGETSAQYWPSDKCSIN